MRDRGNDVAVRKITEHEKKEQAMNDGRDEIRGGLKEVGTEGLVHEGPQIGTRVSIRPATTSDGEGLRGMFSRSSSETIYRRFHTPFSNVPEWMLALMLDVDRHDREFLVAIADGEIVGHAMFARIGDGSEAEMAIVVEDDWQSKGLGKALLSNLADRARLRGIETFIGEVLAENRRMLGLATMFAGTRRTIEDGAYHVRMPLRKSDAIPNTARALRRAA